MCCCARVPSHDTAPAAARYQYISLLPFPERVAGPSACRELEVLHGGRESGHPVRKYPSQDVIGHVIPTCIGVSGAVGVLLPVAFLNRPEGRNSCHPLVGLTLLGCVDPPACVRGVTEERRDPKLL